MNREFDLPMAEPAKPRHQLHCLRENCSFIAEARTAAGALRSIRKHRASKHGEKKGKR